jgi:hypothetical protein
MSTAMANPLQSLINQASNTESTGEVSRLRQRQQTATDEVVILADVSDSMSESAGGKKKIEVLRDALSRVWPNAQNARLIAFSSLPVFLSDPQNLPDPSGSTALHLAIQSAQSFKPSRTLVISDGRPDDEMSAFAAADELTGQIDVIYCGPEGDTQAILFLQRLVRRTGGTCHVTPPQNLLEPVKRLLLLTE